MGFSLIISHSAEAKIDSIIRYIAIELSNPTAARNVLNDIEKAYVKLENSADVFPLCYDPVLFERGYHKYILPKHDYVIIYSIRDNTVFISGIFHMLEDYANKF